MKKSTSYKDEWEPASHQPSSQQGVQVLCYTPLDVRKRIFTLLFMLGFALLAFSTVFATAPECINHIAVNGDLLEGEGFLGQSACYFTAYGDSSNAFTKASVLAEAMGLDLTWETESKTLMFEGGDKTVRLRTTDDVAAGLSFHDDALTVNGAPFRAVPFGILVEGSSWVPVGSIADAFGADTTMKRDLGLIIIETAPQPVVSQVTTVRDSSADVSQDVSQNVSQNVSQTDAPAPETNTESNAEANPEVAQTDTSSAASTTNAGETAGGFAVGAPDVGVYDGYTRVALSLPPDATYSVAVFDATMVIMLPNGRADAGAVAGESAQVKSLRYSSVDGTLALVIGTTYPLSADGHGYQVGFLAADGTRAQARLYVDFGPNLQGRSVTELREAPTEQIVTEKIAEKPAARPKVVVLDPGHGGRWAGARNTADTVQEEVVVLAVALKVKTLLEREGVQVIMTRTANAQLSDDYDGDLVARAGFATTVRNVFVSIHANAGPASAHGIETFVYGQPLDETTLQAAIRENGGGAVGRAITRDVLATVDTMQGDLVAQETLKFSRALAESVQFHLVTETGARDRGVKQAPYRVLTQSRIPSILIETGFVSNPDEGSNLNSEAYQNKLAEGIAAGILGFFDTNGSVATR